MTGKALRFAAAKHEGQRRKFSDQPYVAHPIRVARGVLRFKSTPNPELLQSAALLHDTVEDTAATLTEIAGLFDFNVAAIVEELTSDGDGIERLGKAEYLARSVIGMSSYALTVKLLDRLDNTSDLRAIGGGFAKRYARETKHVLWRLREARTLTDTQDAIATSIWLNVR